jgi:hypothetical protein
LFAYVKSDTPAVMGDRRVTRRFLSEFVRVSVVDWADLYPVVHGVGLCTPQARDWTVMVIPSHRPAGTCRQSALALVEGM